MSAMLLNRASDILARHMWMGNWKSKVIAKKGRGKSESTKLARTYVAIPPATGWLGGRPEDNGLKGRKS